MTDPCIDAEVLAAWIDGALDQRAAGEVVRHAAQCARCQAMLATFVRTELAPSPSQARQAPWWQSFQVRWLVPVAAAATAVAIWIAVPGSPRPEGEVARAPSPPAAGPPAQSPAAPLAAAEPSGTTPDANQRQTAARKEGPAGSRQEAAPGPAPQEERANTLAAAERRAAEAASSTRADGLSRSREAALSPASADAAMVFASRDGTVRWRLAGPLVERSTDGGSTWVAAPLGRAAEQDGRAAAPLATAAPAAAAPADATLDLGPAIVAGDAPTALVCWFVGPRGAVWITTDGGQQFRRVTVTGEPDLRTVRARDARSADVTTVDGRTFHTDDGGATWTITGP